MIGTESHFRQALGPQRASVFLQAIESGQERSRQAAIELGLVERRTEPTLAFDLITRMLNETADGKLGIRRVESNGQNLWVVDETYAIRIKRLTSDYRTINHRSGQQDAIDAQETLPGLPRLVFVSAGMRFSARTGLPIDVLVVKHIQVNGRPIPEWIVNLADLASGSFAATSPVLNLQPATPAAIVATVRSRRSQRDDATGTEAE